MCHTWGQVTQLIPANSVCQGESCRLEQLQQVGEALRALVSPGGGWEVEPRGHESEDPEESGWEGAEVKKRVQVGDRCVRGPT